MLKSILGNGPPEPKTQEEAQDLHSRNFSKPPSQESPKQRAQRTKKRPTGRSHGVQPGHPKHERALLPDDQVDWIQRYYPEGHCVCGGEIQPESDPCHRHQLFDLPEVKFTVTEYQVYAGACGHCQTRHVPTLPDRVPRGQIGAGLISWIALVSGQYHLSTRQIQSLLQQHWQLTFSVGAISTAKKLVSGWLQPLYAQIGEAVRQADVAHADETVTVRGQDQQMTSANGGR